MKPLNWNKKRKQAWKKREEIEAENHVYLFRMYPRIYDNYESPAAYPSFSSKSHVFGQGYRGRNLNMSECQSQLWF